MSPSSPIQHRMEVLASATRQEKEIKGIYNRKEEVKLSLFSQFYYVRDNIIIYGENLMKISKKCTITYDFNKIAGYKINIQNSVIFLLSRNEQSKIKINNAIIIVINIK